MTAADAVAKAKARLDIDSGDTTFDAKLLIFAQDATDRIPPHAYRQVPKQTVTSSTVDSYGEATFDLSALSTPCEDYRKVEASNGQGSWPVKARLHGTIVTVRELPTDVTTFYVYGLKPFLITELPTMFNMGIVWYIMADFYAFLAGNKKSYNVYMQNGRQAVDNMQDLADYWENKAAEYITEKGQLYGR